MNSPFTSSNPGSVTRESSRKRKRRELVIDDQNESAINKTRWRTESEQQIYSSKLVAALRYVCRNASSSSPLLSTNRSLIGRDVRVTADRVLAVTAKGKTRWSRAILKTSRFRMRYKKVNHKKIKETCNRRLRRENVNKKTKIEALPVFHNRVKKLGRLVPGCRKIPFTNLLEEATDYIAALEMQVRAMSAIAELISGSAPLSNRLSSNLRTSS